MDKVKYYSAKRIIKYKDRTKDIVKQYRLTRHSWIFKGDLGAIEFHFKSIDVESPPMDSEHRHIDGFGECMTPGVEIHRSPTDDDFDRIKDWNWNPIIHCDIIKGDCFPGGSGMAGERIINYVGSAINENLIYSRIRSLLQ